MNGGIPGFLQRPFNKPKPFVATFTNLNCYANICEYQAYRRYIAADKLPFKETEAMRYGTKVHAAMEHRIGGKPLPNDMLQWEPLVAPLAAVGAVAEQKLGVSMQGKATGFFADDVYLRGKVDTSVIQGDTAFLADWKTGSEREDPFELEVGAVLLQAKNPQVRTIKGSYVWLRSSKLGMIHDLSDTTHTWNRINGIVTAIEGSKRTEAWPKKKGPLCKWCDCFDCEFNTNPAKP